MANLYDLKKFDLNLLVIFECIYQHLSISKAAATLYITPSAVSQSLQRLRVQLDDPLFIRSGKGITPTTVGINLHLHLEQNLNQIEQTINITHSSSLRKHFVIYCPQLLLTAGLINPLQLLLRSTQFEIEHHDLLMSSESAEDLLAYRKADLIFSVSPTANRSICCSLYKQLPVVAVCRKDHPRLGNSSNLEALLNEDFTFLDNKDPGLRQFQAEVEALLPGRKIAFRSDSFISIMNILSASDLVGLMTENTYEAFKHSLNLKKITLPITFSPFNIYIMYNRASLNNQTFSEFINTITEN
ncbi:LysR family transcriptional regulator [Superficieibacter electus]|uniref:LysR family transcriptional regulator n=1 Tax=Superficieibacter electus TaxID=2022662 RepID=A0A2P5GR10_9ENTR|nr:LysR family transcriptional regulator [Superficieibacter electus]POP43469.1 LysR family transcriptional regulator [Superficieibacter electus]POP48984.1 LysR family transcriptional regulator [Superficieibacter electus]